MTLWTKITLYIKQNCFLVCKCGNKYSIGRQTGEMKGWEENWATSWSKFPGLNNYLQLGIKTQRQWWNLLLVTFTHQPVHRQTDRHTFNSGLSPKRQPRYHPPIHEPSAGPPCGSTVRTLSHADKPHLRSRHRPETGIRTKVKVSGMQNHKMVIIPVYKNQTGYKLTY